MPRRLTLTIFLSETDMQTINVIQGSPEWHAHRRAHFNASDAPAMLGVSPYKSRSQLLNELATGIGQDFDAATQRRFDDGHRFEELARKEAEKIIGEELSPVTGTEGKYSASFDGITFGENICFEHKTLNDELRGIKEGKDLPEHYRVQMEQQLMVANAERCLFVASKWTCNNELQELVHVWYEPDGFLRKRIVDGWSQFEADLAAYVPPVITEKPKAEITIELPTLFVHAKGEITEHNMEAFGTALTARLAEVRAIALVTDQDFSNAKEAAKKFRDTAKAIALSKEQMLAQTETIGEAARKMDAWAKDLNATALQLEKDVEREDLAKKSAMVLEGKSAYAEHLDALESEIKPIRLSLPQPDFAAAIKGKRNYASMHDAIQTMLASAKIAADAAAKDVRDKLAWCKENAAGHSMLFPDLQQIITKPLDDFKLTVTSRIEQHQKAEAAKLESERARIRQEEEAKARAEAEAKLRADNAKPNTPPESEAGMPAGARPALVQKEPAAPSLGTVLHATAPAEVAQGIVPRTTRPTRMQMIEAISQHFSVPVTTADEWLRGEFAEIAA
jgi:putative phage-type endonuclease